MNSSTSSSSSSTGACLSPALVWSLTSQLAMQGYRLVIVYVNISIEPCKATGWVSIVCTCMDIMARDLLPYYTRTRAKYHFTNAASQFLIVCGQSRGPGSLMALSFCRSRKSNAEPTPDSVSVSGLY
eukprot:scpid78666/ scgid15631/ 